MTSFYTTGNYTDFLEKVFGKGHVTGQGKNLQVVCPVCKELKEKHSARTYSNQKLSINLLGKQGVCKCWVCGYKSKNPIHLLKRFFPDHLQEYLDKFLDSKDLQAYMDKKSVDDETPVVVSLPEDFQLLATAPAKNQQGRDDWHIKAARNYLKGRGEDSPQSLWYWRLGISKADTEACNRIIVPSFDQHGILNYYSARAIWPKMKEKYKNPFVLRENIIFNELNIDWQSELILVEGVFDLMKCPENATALLGTDLPSHFLLFQRIVENKTPVVLALDPEAQSKAYQIAKRLREFDVSVKILTLLPGQEDVGSLTKSEFNDLLPCAKLFNMDYLLRSKIKTII